MSLNPEIKTYYDQLAPTYDDSRFANSYGQYIHHQELKVLNKYLKVKDYEHSLDLACGTGRFLGFAKFGLDISPEMLKVAQAQFPAAELREGHGADMPFPEGEFQNILSFHLMMHLQRADLEEILNEAHRILKCEGLFIFDIPSAERRKLINYKAENWHGAHSISPKRLQSILGSQWTLHQYYGIAFLPIHRIPKSLRRLFIGLDNLLSRSFLRRYSSHLIFILRKRC